MKNLLKRNAPTIEQNNLILNKKRDMPENKTIMPPPNPSFSLTILSFYKQQ